MNMKCEAAIHHAPFDSLGVTVGWSITLMVMKANGKIAERELP